MLVLALVPLLVIPPLIWLRQMRYRKLRDRVSLQCRNCGAFNTIEKLANFDCKSCHYENAFFDSSGVRLPGIETYSCSYCSEENMVGVLTCTACGHTNRQGLIHGQD